MTTNEQSRRLKAAVAVGGATLTLLLLWVGRPRGPGSGGPGSDRDQDRGPALRNAKQTTKTPRKTAAQLELLSGDLHADAARRPSSGASPSDAADPVVLVREGNGWRQYFVISDERVAVVEMKPALLGGWRFDRVDVQGKDDWPMQRDAIVAWKFEADDGRTRIAEGLGDFRARLLDVARLGQVPGVDGSRAAVARETEPRNARPRRANLPRYNERKGMWIGGDSRTLYAFTGWRTGQTWVVPGGWTMNYGPEVTVRVATRAEAEELWQRPLHAGWTVDDNQA